MTDHAALSSDRPLTDPAQDVFGHAPFAKTLAKAIRDHRGSDGIVLALYGPWSAGVDSFQKLGSVVLMNQHCIHPFVKAPSVFAMALGHRLNGIGVIQLYDWDKGKYIPTVRLR